MPLYGTIGFSVALFVFSAAAMAEGSSATEPAAPAKPPTALRPAAKAKPPAGRPPRIHWAAKPPAARSRADQLGVHSAIARPPDTVIGPTRSFGPTQVGRASWYGGFHVGMHTASGAVLDSIHATAAHRTLPLNSLARVTNMKNGRSVVVVVNDRGPVSPSFIIDLSPRAARELDMVEDGVVPVKVEPLTETATALQ